MSIGMGSGNVAKKILVSIDVMTDAAQEKLKNFERQTRATATSVEKSVTGNVSGAQQQLDQFVDGMRGIGPAATNAENRTRGLNDRIATFGKDAKFASDMSNQFRMDMLSVMFAGMQLASVFGGMVKSMFSFTGAADAMGAAMKSVMLPITMALQPILLALSEMLIGMDRNQKFVVGLTVVLLALVGALTFLGAQLVMLSSALAGSTIALFGFEIALTALIGLLGALVSGLLIGIAVVAFFGKKVGAIVGVLAALGAVIAAVLGAPLWIIIGLVSIVIGVIIALSDEIMALINGAIKALGEAFNGIIETLSSWGRKFLSTAKKWIGKFIDAFIFIHFKLPKMIGNALLGVLRKIGSFVGRIVSAAVNLGKKLFNGIVDFVSKLPNKIFNTLKTMITKMKNVLGDVGSAALDIGSKIIDKIAEGISNAPDAIMAAIKSIAPDWVVDILGKAGSAISGGVDSVTDAVGNVVSIGDGVIQPNGDVVKTAPDDYLFATNSPSDLVRGGGGNNVTINIDAEVADEIDMKELAKRVGDEFDRRTGGRSNQGRSGGF